MIMSNGEIVRSYQEAAVKEINVLAGFNDCTPAEIREVLEQCGYRYGLDGCPVRETGAPEHLTEKERTADKAGLPTREPSLMDMLEKKIIRATDQLGAAEKAVAEARRVLAQVYGEEKTA